MNKKSWLMILALSFGLAACQGDEQPDDASQAEAEPAEESEQQDAVGVKAEGTQVNSEYNAMNVLLDEEKITYDQLQSMKDLATANYDRAHETGNAFYEELQQMKEEGVEGMDQMIEDAKPDEE